MVSTANSLTITPIDLTTLSALGNGKISQFFISIGGASGQFYGLIYTGAVAGTPPDPAYSVEVFRYGAAGAAQIINNSPPASLVLSCGNPTPASVDLISEKRPQTFSTEIDTK
jgi:hypothetical protein